MKGLILKDLYTIKGFAKQYFMVFCFMVIWSVCMKTTSFGVMYAMLLGGMLVLTTMSTDEASHFNQFALTMPINASELVKAKYALLVLSIGGSTIFGFIINELTAAIPFFEEGFDTVGILAAGSVFMITYAITLPIIYKLGIEKARYTYIVVLIALAALIIGGVKLISLAVGVPIEQLPSPKEWQIVVLLIGIDIVSLIVSFQVSLKVLSQKEW